MIRVLQKYQTAFILLCILLFAFLLRGYNLSNNPPGFFADEASIGYNAYTILHFGTDEYGTPFPFFFKAFGEYKNPVQTYSTVPFIALFGLNEFAARLPSVLYGLLGILAIYLLATSLFHEERYRTLIGYLAALFLAISPWHIQFSRSSLEGLAAYVAFTMLACYFFLKAQSHPKKLFVSLLFFVLAFYSYFPARIFIPLFAGSLFLTRYRFFLRHKQLTAQGIVLLLLCALPILHSIFFVQGMARWQQVNVFSNPPEKGSVIGHIAYNYFSHFSPAFLFTTGDIGMPGQFVTRHSVRGMGEFYLFQAVFVIIGLYLLMKKRAYTLLWFFVFWLLFFPVGSMFTLDKSAQATRSVIGVVPFQLLSAYGLAAMLVYKYKHDIHRYFSYSVITLVILSSFLLYSYHYFVEYPRYASNFWGWQYGARDIVQYFEKEQNKYDELVMAPEFNAPDIFFKFYAPEDCQKCLVGLPHELVNQQKKQLFAIPPSYLQTHPQLHFQTQKTIYYPNGSVAFKIGEVVE